jgi:MoxR-like ATPase
MIFTDNDSMRPIIQEIVSDITSVLLDKENEVQLVICCLLARGHLLIEDHPGVGKTTLVQCLAKVLDLASSRIQFTSDLLPADIVGNSIYDTLSQSFRFHQGPLFASLVLGDELNRANPKTQSALLQALEEGDVTVDGKTYHLPRPFFFIGTQNPRQQTGTFPLPESQLDRFLMSLRLNFASRDTEIKIIQGQDPRQKLQNLRFRLTSADILAFQKQVDEIHISQKLAAYIAGYLDWSRLPQFKGSPLSVRAGMALARAARSWAWMHEMSFVIPEDIKHLAPYILGHRIFPDQGIVDGHHVIQSIANEKAVIDAS